MKHRRTKKGSRTGLQDVSRCHSRDLCLRAYDADRAIMKLITPHETEKVQIGGEMDFPSRKHMRSVTQLSKG